MVHSSVKAPFAVGDVIVSSSQRYEVEKILGFGAFGTVSLCHKFSTNQKVHSSVKAPFAVGDVIVSSSQRYEVEKILGSGAFGTVSLCHKFSTNQKVALKMINITDVLEDPAEEAAMLQTLMDHGGARHHIVEWFGSFESRGHYIHEFEVLDTSLLDYIVDKGTLQLRQIRPIVHQLGTALAFLKGQGIVHKDLKDDNIMLVDRVSKPLKIKMIDFGLAEHVSKMHPRARAQTCPHRAPEVFLGAPYDEAIDMWSVGCIMMELFLGHYLFHGVDNYEAFCNIIKTVGLPSDELLESGWHTHKYLFYKNRRWSFKRCGEIAPTTSALADVFKYTPVNEADQCDSESFLDLLNLMLKVDPAERISPEELLKHSFVTLDHLQKFRDLHPELVSECDKLSSADDEDLNSTYSEELSGPTVSSDQGQSESPSRKRRREEKEDTTYSKRLCEEPAPAPEGPSSCQQSAPAPKGPTKRKRGHESESSDLELDSTVRRKRSCREMTPTRPHCEEPTSAPEGPCHSVLPVAQPRVRNKRRHEAITVSSTDSDRQVIVTSSVCQKRRRVETVDLNCDSDDTVGSPKNHSSEEEETSESSEGFIKCSEDEQCGSSPSNKRLWENQDRIPLEEALLLLCSEERRSCERLSVGPVSELVPVLEGPSHLLQSVVQPTGSTIRRKRPFVDVAAEDSSSCDSDRTGHCRIVSFTKETPCGGQSVTCNSDGLHTSNSAPAGV